jgi:hypothetical protein
MDAFQRLLYPSPNPLRTSIMVVIIIRALRLNISMRWHPMQALDLLALGIS